MMKQIALTKIVIITTHHQWFKTTLILEHFRDSYKQGRNISKKLEKRREQCSIDKERLLVGS